MKSKIRLMDFKKRTVAKLVCIVIVTLVFIPSSILCHIVGSVCYFFGIPSDFTVTHQSLLGTIMYDERSINLHTHSTLQKTLCEDEVDIVIIVKSSPKNKQERTIIRQTWAADNPEKVKVVFIIGTQVG